MRVRGRRRDESEESLTDTAEVQVVEVAPATEERGPRLAAVRSFVSPNSSVPVYVGVVVAIAGLALIAYTWGRVAALTNVALQLPYLVSGGLTGLALVMVGMTIVNVQVRRRDVAERARQMELLTALLTQAAPPGKDASPRPSRTKPSGRRRSSR